MFNKELYGFQSTHEENLLEKISGITSEIAKITNSAKVLMSTIISICASPRADRKSASFCFFSFRLSFCRYLKRFLSY